jgi:hypothetical protein
MIEPGGRNNLDAINRSISLAEAALNECDRHGYTFAAIDISMALDKLNALKAKAVPPKPDLDADWQKTG